MTDETARTESAKPDPTEDDPALDVLEEAVDVVAALDDHQTQIEGLHTRIDEMQQRTEAQFAKQAESLDRILDAVKQPVPLSPTVTPVGPGTPAAEVSPSFDPPGAPLPEGTTRFVSTGGKDFQIRLKQRGYVTVGEGRHEIIPEKFLVFAAHIATTDDPELIDAAREYIKKKGAKAEFFEDPTASPAFGVQVHEGVRDTGATTRMNPTPTQPLAARN
jgi:hypothetical protein